MKKFLSQFSQALREASMISVVAHERPDGDSIGATIAMSSFLRDNYHAEVIPVCDDVVPDSLVFLCESTPLQNHIPKNTQLVIVLDNATPKRLAAPSFPEGVKVINIDHHGSNQQYGDLNYVDDKASSTTSILLRIFQELGWDISPACATALLVGVYTDTGGFLHRNTTQESFEDARDLMLLWADQGLISEKIFKSYSLEFIQGLGDLLSWVQVLKGVGFCSMYGVDNLEDKWLKTMVVTMTNSLQNTFMGCVLQPDPLGVRGSFRTSREDVDVSLMASRFGWWGHQKAAWFLITGATLGEKSITIEKNEYSFSEFITKYCL